MPTKAAKTSRRGLAAPLPPSYEQQLRTLIESSGKWFYWEWDERYRFTVLTGALFERAGIDPEIYLGRTLWEQDGAPFPSGSWDEFRRRLQRRLPFSDFLYCYPDPTGALRYVSGNGQPVFDARGRFRGYRGVSKDITERVAIERRRALEHGAARVLANAGSIAEANTGVIENVCAALGWPGGLRWELDPASQTLHGAESWHDAGAGAGPVIARLKRSALRRLAADPLLHAACRSGRPTWVDLQHQRHPFLDPGPELRGALLVPIRAGERTLGLLQLFAPCARAPDEELLQGAAFVGAALGDFWHRKRAEEELLHFRAAMDTSGDPIYLIDRASLRIIDVNETACRAMGYTREELLRMSPQELQLVEREQLERAYDDTIAAGAGGLTTEVRARARDGRISFAELHRRAVRIGSRWIIVTVARDITQRKRAEDATRRLGRMYATLSATGEAIIRAGSPAQLYAEVCQAAVGGGQFVAAAVILPDPAGAPGAVQVAAAAHRGTLQLSSDRLSVDPARAEGCGLVGTAFRARAPAVSNDLLRDERMRPWHERARADGIASAAAVPLLREQTSIGVLIFYSPDVHAFDDDIVRLLQRMAANLVFALDALAREAERARTEEALRESEARFRSLAELGSDWYWETDAQARFTRFEGRLVTRHPHAFHGYLGKRVWDLGFQTDDSWEAKRRLIEARQPFRDFVYFQTRPDGRRRYFLASGQPHFDPGGRFLGYRGVGRDITGQKRAEEQIQYLATHDTVTGLPNRALFGQLLRHALASAHGRPQPALLVVDIDRFKIINDSLGHEAGDALLRELATRLQHAGNPGDVVARIGGDEFVVLARAAGEREQAAAVARRILSAVIRPVELMGRECRVTASVGIARYPEDGGDEHALLKSADSAMHFAKQEGKNNFQFHASGLRSYALERLTLEAGLRHALERNELYLHYQPRRSLRTGAITGVEALLRWRSPELGEVSPAQMIPLAEETGLIVPIGRWVLHSACRQNMAWQRQGLAPIRMAVNLSSRQFADAGLVADIRSALRESGMAPALLELELTESMVVHDSARTAAVIADIKNLGARLAIDDFGTGYSSLAQLKRIPADTLKVDRSFIRDIPGDAEDRAITEAIIAMGKTLNLTVVAEGVETAAQEQFLRARACDEIQGYYFSRPVAADAVPALLAAHPPAFDN